MLRQSKDLSGRQKSELKRDLGSSKKVFERLKIQLKEIEQKKDTTSATQAVDIKKVLDEYQFLFSYCDNPQQFKKQYSTQIKAAVIDLEEQKAPQQDFSKMDNKALMQRARDNSNRFTKNMEKAAD